MLYFISKGWCSVVAFKITSRITRETTSCLHRYAPAPVHRRAAHAGLHTMQPKVPSDSASKVCIKMENNRKRTVLLAERIAENHTDLYAAFKNTFEVKLVSSSNATFCADCILNNMPFLFLLNGSQNLTNRIRLFVQQFKSRYVILFSNKWNIYKQAMMCVNDKTASAEKNGFVPMYYGGRTVTEFVNTTIAFSHARSEEKLLKIKDFVNSVKHNATTFSKDQLISALARTMQMSRSDAESILLCFRTLYEVSEAVGKGKEFLLMHTPIDKEKIDVLYDMFTKHRE